MAILTVATQSGKNLDVGARTAPPPSSTLYPQRQFPAGPGAVVPQYLGNYGEVAVASADNGTTKTWTLTVRLNPCREVVFLEITAVNPDGTRSASHLDVALLRNSNEVQQTGCPVLMSRARLISIAPTHGAPETMATLTGSGFSSTSVQVKFGNLAPIPARLDSALTTTTVAVPQAAFGPVSVSIIDPAYGQTTVVNFTITGATPVITGLTPGSVPRGGLVTLTGQNFGNRMVIQLVPSVPPISLVDMNLAGTFARFRVPSNANVGVTRAQIGYANETFSNLVTFTVTP